MSNADGPEPSHTPATPKHQRSLRKSAVLTAVMGLTHSALVIVSFLLTVNVPGPEATDAELIAYYGSDQRRVVLLVGLYLIPFAAIAFMWFIVALRMWIAASGSREDALFSNIQLVSGIAFVTLLLAASGASSVLASSVENAGDEVDLFLARQFPQYGSTLLLVFAARMGAMFVFTTSNIGRTTGVLPRWFVWTSFAVGLFLALTASLARFLILVFPLWVLVLSIILLGRARRIPPNSMNDREPGMDT